MSSDFIMDNKYKEFIENLIKLKEKDVCKFYELKGMIEEILLEKNNIKGDLNA